MEFFDLQGALVVNSIPIDDKCNAGEKRDFISRVMNKNWNERREAAIPSHISAITLTTMNNE